MLLAEIRKHESLENSELRSVLEKVVPLDVRKKVGGYVGKHLVPKIDKQATDFLMGYLDMGTWTLIGEINRVYRGPNCEYKGWQRNIVTTPEALLDDSVLPPFHAALDAKPATHIDCSPQESREFIIQRVRQFFPEATIALEKLIDG